MISAVEFVLVGFAVIARGAVNALTRQQAKVFALAAGFINLHVIIYL